MTLYLMLIGIASRVGAELVQPMPVGVGLGILAAGTELAAITMFIVIIVKTARQSVEPHQIYEKFIFGAFFWFFVQAIVSDLLFFAKATAVGVDQVVMRIALIDGPLRVISCWASERSSSPESASALCPQSMVWANPGAIASR